MESYLPQQLLHVPLGRLLRHQGHRLRSQVDLEAIATSYFSLESLHSWLSGEICKEAHAHSHALPDVPWPPVGLCRLEAAVRLGGGHWNSVLLCE